MACERQEKQAEEMTSPRQRTSPKISLGMLPKVLFANPKLEELVAVVVRLVQSVRRFKSYVLLAV